MSEEIKPAVVDFNFVSHISFVNCGVRIDAGTVVWPGNPIDGQKLCRQVTTKKTKMGGYGKGRAIYFLSGDKTPEFDTIEKFYEHYKVKDIAAQPAEEPVVRVKIKTNAKKKKSRNQ